MHRECMYLPLPLHFVLRGLIDRRRVARFESSFPYLVRIDREPTCELSSGHCTNSEEEAR